MCCFVQYDLQSQHSMALDMDPTCRSSVAKLFPCLLNNLAKRAGFGHTVYPSWVPLSPTARSKWSVHTKCTGDVAIWTTHITKMCLPFQVLNLSFLK